MGGIEGGEDSEPFLETIAIGSRNDVSRKRDTILSVPHQKGRLIILILITYRTYLTLGYALTGSF